jgi:hypothetical protein
MLAGLLFCGAFVVISFFAREQPENTYVLKKAEDRLAKRRVLINCPRERPPDMGGPINWIAALARSARAHGRFRDAG